MANRLVPLEEIAAELAADINAIAAEHGVNPIDLALLFGASIGAPVDVSHLLTEGE
ncbi:hypothetical protein PQQ63_15295 [Paraburkholderia metrosideri]|uniref:Uncharacterized protein n=1 Tax=Paraburkholderia metrosideri TaxID=580937 RepID=A0ABW9DTB7_9BURK